MNLININKRDDVNIFTCENLFQYISSEELWTFIKRRVLSLKEKYFSNQKIYNLITDIEKELNRIQCSYNLTTGEAYD